MRLGGRSKLTDAIIFSERKRSQETIKHVELLVYVHSFKCLLSTCYL